MRFVFASDSFKGSLTSAQCAALLEKAAKSVFPDCSCTSIPVADGGEGTTDAVLAALGGEKRTVSVHGPLGDPTLASFALLPGNRALIEMAQASGLTLIPRNKRNPMRTSTFGTGELLRAALDAGCRELYIAIGGSATNDGGMGFLRALGARFLDGRGRELSGCGEDLQNVETIDVEGLDPRLSTVSITVMSDVKNPLCGENGATRVFGPQKGADPQMVEALEQGMTHYRDVIRDQFHEDPDAIPGAGAAGGLGCALAVFLKAQMRSGIDVVLDLVGFDQKLAGADLVITGEGRCDAQSAYGKVLSGIGERAKKSGVPALALCGSLGPGYEAIYDHGITSLLTCVDGSMSVEEAMERAEELYEKAAVRLFRLVRLFSDRR